MRFFKIFRLLYNLLLPFFIGNVSYARKKGVRVGEGCRIYITSWGSEPFLIDIGNRVTVTSGVRIITHDGSTWLLRDSAGQRYQYYNPVLIGDDVFIGVNSIIMPGIKIGSRCVVGAGSVVTKDVPDGCVVAGNPAKVITTFDELEVKLTSKAVHESDLISCKSYKEKVMRAISISSMKR